MGSRPKGCGNLGRANSLTNLHAICCQWLSSLCIQKLFCEASSSLFLPLCVLTPPYLQDHGTYGVLSSYKYSYPNSLILTLATKTWF